MGRIVCNPNLASLPSQWSKYIHFVRIPGVKSAEPVLFWLYENSQFSGGIC